MHHEKSQVEIDSFFFYCNYSFASLYNDMIIDFDAINIAHSHGYTINYLYKQGYTKQLYFET